MTPRLTLMPAPRRSPATPEDGATAPPPADAMPAGAAAADRPPAATTGTRRDRRRPRSRTSPDGSSAGEPAVRPDPDGGPPADGAAAADGVNRRPALVSDVAPDVGAGHVGAGPDLAAVGGTLAAEEGVRAAAEGVRAAALEAAYHGVVLPRADAAYAGAPGCQRCEVLPDPVAGPGTLHLRTPHTHTLGKVLGLLAASAWRHVERLGTVSVHVPRPDLGALLGPLAAALTSTEQRDVRVVYQPDGRLLALEDYFAAEPLAAFLARAGSGWLLDMLRGGGLRSVFQPIAEAASVTTGVGGARTYAVHGYECLARGTRAGGGDGGEVAPGPMFALARGADLVFQLDLAARRAAVLGAARARIAERVFINFTPHAIYEPQSCLRSTLALCDEVGLRREQVVFEVVETERFDDLALLRRIADYYRERGFGVALDDVGAGYASLNALVALRPDYAKLDMALTRGVDRDPARAAVAAATLDAARALGCRTVVEGVETAGECAWAVAHGADYLQGYYIARPAATPPLPAPPAPPPMAPPPPTAR